MLVFAWHISVLEHLRRRLAQFDPVMVTGATNPTGRVTAIDQFQHRRNVRVFLGQILACGTAITLTAANEVAIVEPSWVPGENVQAICRAHRLGQRDSVLASFLYLPDTLDERIMRTFRRKAVEISELHDPKDDETHESASAGQRDIRSGGRHRSSGSLGPDRPAVQGGGDRADSAPRPPGGPYQPA
jgi:SWI/SNF-related matrix-associated actin-dependent regulator 1 of chromatin subfamily A